MTAQVGFDDHRVVQQVLRLAFQDDPPGFQHVAAVGDGERHLGILLDQQDAGALGS